MAGEAAECGLGLDLDAYKHPDWAQAIEKGGYYHAMVTDVSPARVMVKIGQIRAVMTPADWKWTQNLLATAFLTTGGCGLCAGGRRFGGRNRCRLRCSRIRVRRLR